MTAAYLNGPEVTLDRRSGCTGKFAYASRADAAHVAGKRGAGKAYKCRHCGQ